MYKRNQRARVRGGLDRMVKFNYLGEIGGYVPLLGQEFSGFAMGEAQLFFFRFVDRHARTGGILQTRAYSSVQTSEFTRMPRSCSSPAR